jgi:hypothetical protein
VKSITVQVGYQQQVLPTQLLILLLQVAVAVAEVVAVVAVLVVC